MPIQLAHSTTTLSSLIMGMWQAGKTMWPGVSDADIREAIAFAMDCGITTFDTAPLYGKGHSERALGKALRPSRDKAQILTKVSPGHLSYDKVIAACNLSLRHLQTDYIDLYQIHWPSGSFGTPVVPISETISALLNLKEEGKIKSIGVSNFNLPQLKEAFDCGPIDTLQAPYSLFWTHIEEGLMPFCSTHNIHILGYSPLAQGLLTGKFPKNHVFDNGDHRRSNVLFGETIKPVIQESLTKVKQLARDIHVSPAQLALAWVLSNPAITPIVGVRNKQQLFENYLALQVSLPSEYQDALNEVSLLVRPHLDDNPVLWRK